MQKMIAVVIIVGLVAVAIYHVFVADDQGQLIYKYHCSACHARGIDGAPELGDKDAWAPRIAKGIDVLYASALNGLDGMPPKGGSMDVSDADIESAVDYMVSESDD
uniref:Cytochrome C oxidase, cbb3-type, subunit III n=1 Tax=Candidatus Kentrum sp. LFY TaxID=2126342 RepID=A0A450UF28_9GAMM|nr:MAG: Cytochrome C oxidase, cbb3-type, subunit III [Candidatus Kentron sp. LFY]VFJ92139.1 MAG: Cytochrome C oxidase, cbb3-type, subunit III [Candidatus Kentron sp. LFY]VFK22436.1 MAG: Cytochrome C oxidase, cbb3-type, subunit III [Candidatus Kentron sp. LFY]